MSPATPSPLLWRGGAVQTCAANAGGDALAALHYGTAAFEGILAVQQPSLTGRCVVFRLEEHMERLGRSAAALGLGLECPPDALSRGAEELLRRLGPGSYYLRPVARGEEDYLSPLPAGDAARCTIFASAFPLPLFLVAMERPRSAWIGRRAFAPPAGPLARAKLSGRYLGAVLALAEARREGYEEAILLDRKGRVTEATSANVFAVSGGRLLTPPAGNILPGMTREAVLRLAGELGIPAAESVLHEEDLLRADEIFLTSTAQGIISIGRLHGRRGAPGAELAGALRRAYVARLTSPDRGGWEAWCQELDLAGGDA